MTKGNKILACITGIFICGAVCLNASTISAYKESTAAQEAEAKQQEEIKKKEKIEKQKEEEENQKSKMNEEEKQQVATEEETTQEEQILVQEEQIYYYDSTADYSGYVDSTSSGGYTQTLTDGSQLDFASQGVIVDNGVTYTYYSSNVAYHYQTPEWTLGSDGIYRTSEGYVVVASSDYAQGTVIDTIFGQAQVLDTGCGNGVIDVYTAY